METGVRAKDQPQGAVALQTGTRIGKYEIGPRLGVGSMGAVYEALRTSDRKRVAIKVLGTELAKQPVARARFLDEGKLTARVRHPNIVDVIETGEDGDRAFLVMDLLEGEDLARRLRAGAMDIADAVDLLIPVCDAVARAHGQGITHRDLKPSNIFLAAREGRTQPIVLDFGIATQGGGAAGRPGGTPGPGPRVVFGTPYYLAPEQVADHRAAGPASDQYALGVILYECLTGEPPYGGDDIEQLFKVIVAGDAPAPRTRRADIPAELETVVLRAMSPKPGDRFASVADFAKALLPFASAPAKRAPAARRRPPSSPAIEAEAATPSPFVRTLTPEIQSESGPWFVAPVSPGYHWEDSTEETTTEETTADTTQDTTEETTLPTAIPAAASDGRGDAPRLRKTILGFPSGRESKRSPKPDRNTDRNTDRKNPDGGLTTGRSTSAPDIDPRLKAPPEMMEAEEPWTDPAANRRRGRLLAVGGAAAVSIISLIVVVVSGGSEPRSAPPLVSTVQTLSPASPAASPPPSPAPQPTRPAEATGFAKSLPPTESPEPAARKRVPSPPAAAVANREAMPAHDKVQTTRAAGPAPGRPEGASSAPVAAKKPSSPPGSPTLASPATAARRTISAAPRPVNVATAGVRQERPAATSATDGGPRELSAPPRPRETGSRDVKTHNGVPLLD